MPDRVTIRLLGGFAVDVDGVTVDDSSFERRHGALLVKLLALAAGRRLHREQVIDALWPEATIDEAAPRLHKAASFARSALRDKQAITIREETVALWPDFDLAVDVEDFEHAADLAHSGALVESSAAADLYGGDLLPDDPYEEWVIEERERLRLRYVEVLRSAERWEALLDVEPADEAAHLALMRRFLAEGRRLSTIRQYERLERALNEELGVSPSDEAIELRRQVLADQEDEARLIDRSSEREVMQRALDEAHAGSGSFVLLSGVPGIGKSALGRWLVDRAQQQGFSTGQAVAASVDGPWPYAPVLEAIDDLLRQHPELLDDLPASHRDELLRVRGAAAAPHEQPGDHDGHQRLFVAVDELINRAARSHGLILFIDDLHAADDASLTLLHYVARRAGRERLLLVATVRSGVDIEATLGDLVGRKGAHELRISPLADEHAAELAGSLAREIPSATVDRIVSLSGGTPFYVEELTKSWRSGTSEELPDRLAAIVSASLAGISSELQDVLARVAIAGLKFDTDQFVALSGIEEEQAAFALLDEALANEIVEHTSGGYRFRHGLLREHLLADLAPHHRRLVHRDAAHRFASLGSPPSRVAHHLIEAGEPAEAAPWALAAARAAQSVGALSDGRALVDAVVNRADTTNRIELLALRADLLSGMGDPGAIAAFQQALAETDGPIRRLLRAKMARTALMSGDVEAAQAVLEGLEPDGGPFDGPVLHAKGMLAYFTGDLDRAEEAAAEARNYALTDGAPAKLLDVLTLQGMVAHNKGEWFGRMRTELTSTADSSELAATVFDCHL